MKTRRQFLTQTLRGIAGLSAVAFLGMKAKQVWERIPGTLHGVRYPAGVQRRSGTKFIAELKPGWDYEFAPHGIIYGVHPDHPVERMYERSDGKWIAERFDVGNSVTAWVEIDPPTRGQG